MRYTLSAVAMLCCLFAIMFVGEINAILAQSETTCEGLSCDVTNTVSPTPSRPPRISAEPSAFSGVRELCVSLCLPIFGFMLAGLWKLIKVLMKLAKFQERS